MDSFDCPYCGASVPSTYDTCRTRQPSFESECGKDSYNNLKPSTVNISFFLCPKCKKYNIHASGIGKVTKGIEVPIMPISKAKQFPDYIPKSIRSDYEEAYAIVNLSPKASATLSRRCLQGMIRDFFQIKENNLFNAINKLEGKIPAQQWRVIDGIRRIGNIGAHMEKDINLIVDIEPDEATKLLKLIEHLLQQWYINRYEQQQLYDDIINIDNAKQAERKKAE